MDAPDRRSPGPVLGTAIALLLTIGACSSRSGDIAAAPDLAFDPGIAASTSTSTGPPTSRPSQPSPPTTADPSPPVAAGTPERPFAPLPAPGRPRAVVTPSGVVLPVVPDSTTGAGGSHLVATACGDVRFVSGVEPIGRAHVVLDPGHGGREYGATGATVVEKDLNLAVTNLAAERLRALGATVVLTRTGDYTVANLVRAMLARTVDPALFLSIHHNGGGAPGGDRPGTMVFTKSGSVEADRAGGLINELLTDRLAALGAAEIERRDAYVELVADHEAAIEAYDRSLAARDAALVANGQIDPASTTLPPEPGDPADADHVPSGRQPVTTTTAPVPAGRIPVPVPDTSPVPPPFGAEPVPVFSWSGSGNAGVRSWTGHDGRDILSVLRRSGDVPAALVEFLYVTNPAEERLLERDEVIELEAQALVDAVVAYFSTDAPGSGFVDDEVGDQNIGGGGRPGDCVEPELGLDD